VQKPNLGGDADDRNPPPQPCTRRNGNVQLDAFDVEWPRCRSVAPASPSGATVRRPRVYLSRKGKSQASAETLYFWPKIERSLWGAISPQPTLNQRQNRQYANSRPEARCRYLNSKISFSLTLAIWSSRPMVASVNFWISSSARRSSSSLMALSFSSFLTFSLASRRTLRRLTR
jgi:hypothetical protein